MVEEIKKFEFSKIEYEKAYDSANHYENYIWITFSTIVLLSLWILYAVCVNNEININVKITMAVFGFLLCIYSILVVVNLNQKRRIKYAIIDIIEKEKKAKGEKIFEKINYLKIRNFGVLLILFIILFLYFIVFSIFLLKISLVVSCLYYLFCTSLLLVIIFFTDSNTNKGIENWKKKLKSK